MSNTDAAALPPNPTTEQLPDDPAVLKRMVLELLATLAETRQEREQLQQRLHLLLTRIYGRKTERFDPNQPLLFADLNPGADTPADTHPADAEPTSRSMPLLPVLSVAGVPRSRSSPLALSVCILPVALESTCGGG